MYVTPWMVDDSKNSRRMSIATQSERLRIIIQTFSNAGRYWQVAVTLAGGSYEQLNKHKNTSEGFSRKRIYFSGCIWWAICSLQAQRWRASTWHIGFANFATHKLTKNYLLIKIQFPLLCHIIGDIHTIFINHKTQCIMGLGRQTHTLPGRHFEHDALSCYVSIFFFKNLLWFWSNYKWISEGQFFWNTLYFAVCSKVVPSQQNLLLLSDRRWCF